MYSPTKDPLILEALRAVAVCAITSAGYERSVWSNCLDELKEILPEEISRVSLLHTNIYHPNEVIERFPDLAICGKSLKIHYRNQVVFALCGAQVKLENLNALSCAS